jgi:hypothetical protein
MPALMLAQGRGPAPPRSGKEAAPVDLTGYWVSVVTEDWRWRMVTPLKGDAASVPINAEGRKIVDAWDPAIMRVPGRLHITWQDDNTLKMELDSGTQVRVFQFGGQAPVRGEGGWQGYSAARWEPGVGPGPAGVGFIGTTRQGVRSRSLEVTTTNLRAGYLRKNGVPYSDKTTVTEYYDLFKEPNGDEWFTVTTIVTDPVYLAIPFVTTTDFKRERDGGKWAPTPCTAR